MLTTAEIILEYACPAAGMVCANWMFMAPLNDVRKAAAAGSLGELNPTPWAVMLGNTLGWVSYALLRNNWFIFFANAPGFLLSIYFNATAMKLLYAATLNTTATTSTAAAREMSSSATSTSREEASMEHKESPPVGGIAKESNDNNNRNDNDNDDAAVKTMEEATTSSVALTDPSSRSLVVSTPIAAVAPLTMVQTTPTTSSSPNDTVATTASASPTPPPSRRLQSHERLVLLMIIVWMGVLTCIIAADSWDDDLKQMVTGLVVNGNLVFFYGSPLSTIRQVLQTRSSRWLHGPTMLRNTANGVFWTAYGLAVLDPYVAIPNGLGALLGVVQMFLWIIFPRRRRRCRRNCPVKEQDNHDNNPQICTQETVPVAQP